MSIIVGALGTFFNSLWERREAGGRLRAPIVRSLGVDMLGVEVEILEESISLEVSLYLYRFHDPNLS